MENKELLEKARQANSPEELLALAKENDVELTQEQAEAYFDQMNKSGELADDELDNVAGGTCYKGKRPVVTVGNTCEYWTCKLCGDGKNMQSYRLHWCNKNPKYKVEDNTTCNTCKYCKYESALWLCYHPDRQK